MSHLRLMLQSLWLYRSFVWGTVHRNVVGSYQESVLGGLWSIANPLTMILIYTLIFKNLMHPQLAGYTDNPYAYSIYLCSGLLTWNCFSEMLSGMQNVFVNNRDFLKKVNFPRITLPVTVVLSSLVNFALFFTLFLVFVVGAGAFPGWSILMLIPLLLLQIAFTVGLGLILGVANVFFRDVGQTVGVVLQFMFWVTPIIYVRDTIPAWAQSLLWLNPMTILVESYHKVFLNQGVWHWQGLAFLVVVSVVLLLIGGKLFLNQVGEMVDEL